MKVRAKSDARRNKYGEQQDARSGVLTVACLLCLRRVSLFRHGFFFGNCSVILCVCVCAEMEQEQHKATRKVSTRGHVLFTGVLCVACLLCVRFFLLLFPAPPVFVLRPCICRCISQRCSMQMSECEILVSAACTVSDFFSVRCFCLCICICRLLFFFLLGYFLTVFLILWFRGLLSSFGLPLRFFFSSLHLLEWLATSALLRMATTLFVFFVFEGCFHFSVSLSCCFRASFYTYLYGCILFSVCSFWQRTHIACDDKSYGKPPTV